VTAADIVGAFVVQARAIGAIAAKTNTRISGTRQTAWTLPAYAIVVNGPLGGPPADAPLRRARLQLECYGPDERTSKELAEIVVQAFVPDDLVSAAFTAAHTVVGEIEKESEPIWLPDPTTGWPRTIVPVIATYLGLGV
jgi:hypothetical protein